MAVELDTVRLASLFEKRKQKFTFRDVRKMGFVTFLFMTLASYVQRKLGEKVGIAPGSDIKTAINAARKVEARIALIDQDIRVTLHKLSKSMSFWNKLKLMGYLLFGFLQPKPKALKNMDLTKVPEEEVVDLLTRELKNKLPFLYEVLINDRDKYMAHQIKHILEDNPDAKVIVVVGAGHVKGIKSRLKVVS